MMSYRFRRRAFLTGLSGGIGLKIMLRTLESSAQTTRSPARLLVTHWPVGIVAGSNDALWKPSTGSVGGSPALQRFNELGLGPNMTVLRGVSTAHLPAGGGGGHEAGTVMLVTGISPGGTRSGELEADDSYAAGPSIDQLLLQKVPALQRPGVRSTNVATDCRTDFGEISTKTLSYSTQTQSVPAFSGSGTEAIPLLPTLSPLQQYNSLFGNFVPGTTGASGSGGSTGGAGGTGGGSAPVADAMLKNLVARRSVLDFSIAELTQLKRMAPSDAKSKLTNHTDAVTQAENALTNAINTRYPAATGVGGATGSGFGGVGGDPTCSGGCRTKPTAPPTTKMGFADPSKGFGNSFGNPAAQQDDSPVLQEVGNAHFALLKAAFICDLVRVGTFFWAPGTNHTGFGLFPGMTQPFQHHPTSHRISTPDTIAASTLGALSNDAQFLFNCQTWYLSRYAEIFADWSKTIDGCGNNLLDFTCVPLLTEVAACGHERNNMPAMIIGGKQLGFAHNKYVTGKFTIGAYWGTVAQAFGFTSTDAPFEAPIAGLWSKPA